MRDFLRWVAVVPAAIAAYVLSNVPVLVVTLGTSDWWAQLMQCIVNPVAGIWVGAKVAPKRGTTVAAVLALAQVVISTGWLLYAVKYGLSEPLWWIVIFWGAGVWGSIVGYVVVQATSE